MQAIGFLSRREHSRQELRRKLLDALRKQAREDASLAAAAQELGRAAREQPSNGIDDAFAPPAPAAVVGGAARARLSRARARETAGGSPMRGPTPAGSAIDGLALASGAPLPQALRSRIAAAAALPEVEDPAHAGAGGAGKTALAPLQRLRDAEADPHFAALDGDEMVLQGGDMALEAELFADVEPDLRASSRRHAPPAADASDRELAGSDPEAEVDRLLDWLVANKYLSDARFVESRVNARSRKQGTLRIRMELSRHGLALEPEQAAALRETEFARARDLWQRRFGEVATDPKQRAKQARFLAARGFAADVVRRVVGGIDED